MPLEGFHPAVTAWFDSRFSGPTPPQAEAWPSIRAGGHTLIAAPTGSGKTLAAFLAAIDDLVQRSVRGELADETLVVYVSPLKALSNDIQKNLQEPLTGIGAELTIRGFPEHLIRTMVRTGDTPAKDRNLMVRKPPHIVVTTPESLYILLTSERGRNMLRTVRTIIVDEIHALVGNKRGTHLALTLERLEHLVGEPLVRVGLSATQKPIEDVARFLVGERNTEDGRPRCRIIDSGHVRKLDVAVEIPNSPLEAVMSAEVWEEVHARIVQLIQEHRTTLIFVNTRRLAERVARHLSDVLGKENVTSHHGSLSKEKRLDAEQRLKGGDLKALVATASLELGIDIGDVDLVCQIGSTRAIATFLQRVGRSGHAVSGLPKGRIFPLSRDELVECAALLHAVRKGELDRLIIPAEPLDILAQQIVAATAGDEWKEDALYDLVRNAYPYRNLSRKDFDEVVHMVAHGFGTRRGRRGAYVHRDAVNRRIRPRRGARLAAITSGGAIPDNADFQVVQEPTGAMVGTVNEDFATESMAGDIFQLGNTSWQILRIETGTVRVQDAHGQPPTIPFWLGEAPGRSVELSAAVARLREELDARLEDWAAGFHDATANGAGLDPVRDWLMEETGLGADAAEQIVEYLSVCKLALGHLPTQNTLVMERFFDESGGMQLVLHSPFGSRLNRAWGLALRKRFCRKFNFELQAAATEDAIILSLGPTHSFPLAEVYRYLNAKTVRHLLIQALLDAPMFAVRWRWNAGRALAILRFAGGRKVPPQLQRMQAEDLVSLVFPDQLACFENIQGEREIPDHPLVNETIRDCLTEAMDIDHLEALLARIEAGDIRLLARDLREPSPLAQEILNAKPYAFLDDAPLEERRTQAVMSRRWLDPKTAADLGSLDADAIARVKTEAWPDPLNADELHDALLLTGFLTAEEGAAWTGLFESLVAEGRATALRPDAAGGTGREPLSASGASPLWVAAERLHQFTALFPQAVWEPRIASPGTDTATRDEALLELCRSRLEALGPVTPDALAAPLGLSGDAMAVPLTALESEGFAIQGTFTPGVQETEWCDRRLLARIHRYTLNRLRQEIEPVSADVFMRYLFRHHGMLPSEQGEGPASLTRVVELMEGFEAAAVAWEGDILPARVKEYDPAWLDALCLSGKILWGRLTVPRAKNGRQVSPLRTTPIALLDRRRAGDWIRYAVAPSGEDAPLRSSSETVLRYLRTRGASFFPEIAEGTRLLPAQVKEALAELAAAGLVTADGFAGLRALLVTPNRSDSRRRRAAAYTVEEAGRWTLFGSERSAPGDAAGSGADPAPAPADQGNGTIAHSDESLERIAWALLRRYGIVFKRLLERESCLPPWRNLLRVYHRLEARGEIRGGRFVAGFSGEQFALPDAVGSLREIRRAKPDDPWVSVSGADPLNLAGILTPGPRVPALPGNRILFKGGEVVAVRVAGEVRMLAVLESGEAWKARKALDRQPYPPRLRAYLGRR